MTKLYDFLYMITHNVVVRLGNKDIPRNVPKDVKFSHSGIGVVINSNAIIGHHCKIGQNVTIGTRHLKSPVIGAHSIIFPNSVIIGDVKIGHHSVIASGSVVLSSFEPYTVIAGNPAKEIKKITSLIQFMEYYKLLT